MRFSDIILIYRLGSIGDTIVTLPIINKINELNPKKDLYILTNESPSSNFCSMESILGTGGIIKKFITYKSHKLSITKVFNLYRKIRKLKVESIYYLADRKDSIFAAWRDYLFFKLCGAKEIVGFPYKKSLRCSLTFKNNIVERECCRLVRCFSSLGKIDLDDKSLWDLHFTKEEVDKFNNLKFGLNFTEIICINMGGKLKDKDWGREKWKNLIKRINKLLKETNILLMIVGSSDDFKRGEYIKKFWQGESLNLCGITNPRESAYAISRSNIFIGHDSGPIHLAEASKVPCVGIYGPNSKPERWHPYGSFNKILHSSINTFEVRVDDVYKNFIELRKSEVYQKKKVYD